MDFPNDSERSWIVGHNFDSTVWFMDIYCAHRGVTPLAARPPLERDQHAGLYCFVYSVSRLMTENIL